MLYKYPTNRMCVVQSEHSYHLVKINLVLLFWFLETVFVNEGEHYDPYDGVCLAPQKGVYLFSWTVSGTGGIYMVTALVVEQNKFRLPAKENGGGDYPSGSMTALCKMEKGDHAWIRTTGVAGLFIYL